MKIRTPYNPLAELVRARQALALRPRLLLELFRRGRQPTLVQDQRRQALLPHPLAPARQR
jgi:hypothetical protein